MLISDRHKGLYTAYYKAREIPGGPSRWQEWIEDYMDVNGLTSLLDYGCGGFPRLQEHMDPQKYQVRSYDPALPGYDHLPEPAQLVVAIDIMEHVEPATLDDVMEHIKSLAQRVAMFSISTQESSKILPDGSAWHSIVRPAAWWIDKIQGHAVIDESDGREEVTILWFKNM